MFYCWPGCYELLTNSVSIKALHIICYILVHVDVAGTTIDHVCILGCFINYNDFRKGNQWNQIIGLNVSFVASSRELLP